MPTRAHEVLSKSVLRVDSATTLSDTLIEIRRKHASHVAVFSQGECLGVSSFDDIDVPAESSRHEHLVEYRPCPIVSDTTSLEELGRLFAEPNVEAHVVHDDQGKFLGVVTRQSLLEALLKKSDQHQEVLQRNEKQRPHDRSATQFYREAPVGLCCFDTRLRYIDINDWLAEFNGLSVEEHLGRTVGELFPELASGLESHLRHVIETGQPVLQGLVIAEMAQSPDVERFVQYNFSAIKSSDGAVVGVSCAAIELSEQKQAEKASRQNHGEENHRAVQHAQEHAGSNQKPPSEFAKPTAAVQALNESELRLKTIIGDAPVVMMSVKPNGVIDLFNGNALNPCETQDGQLSGTNYFELWKDRPCMTAAMRKCLAGDVTEPTRIEILGKQLEARFSRIEDSEGVVTGAIIVCVDIAERQKTENALKEQTELNEQIRQTTLDGFILADSVGQILDVNSSYSEMVGYSRQELLEMSINDVECRLSSKEIERRIAVILRDGRARFETNHRCKDGSVLDLDVSIAVITSASGPLVSAFVRDVTDRKKNEIELNSIFELSLDLICVADIETATFVKVNPSFVRVLGYSEEELLGRTFLDFIHPDDVESTMEVINRELKSGNKLMHFENRYRTKKGDYRWLNWTGNPNTANGLTYGIARDITESKLAEEALRASETRSRTLLEGSPVCIKFIDLNSQLQYMSRAGQEQLKISDIEPFYGSTFPPELYPESWRSTVCQHLERAKAGEKSSLECPVYDTEGNEVWFATTFVPSRSADGRIQNLIVTSVNITDRKRMEQETLQHRKELAHVSRVSTMGEMATGIAHELNQPLAAIALYSSAADSVAERLPTIHEELHKILSKLRGQAVRAGEIVQRLREFVKKGEPVRVQSDLNAVVQDVAKFVEPDIHQSEATLVLKFDGPSPKVVVDEIQIQQVLVNLIRNSLNAMKETPADHREVTISTGFQNGHAQVLVSDVGKGLTQDELEQVFDTFFSTKQEGMGLGLPISRSIIEAHGGKLWAKSNIGPGATFGFTIPQEDIAEYDRNPKVFVVDDESVMRDALSLVVQDMGLAVKTFSSARKFLEFIDAYDISGPVCMVLDVQMPKIDGMELLKQLNILDKKIPTILISGLGTKDLEDRAKKLGAVAFLEKPFQPDELKEIITTNLDR